MAGEASYPVYRLGEAAAAAERLASEVASRAASREEEEGEGRAGEGKRGERQAARVLVPRGRSGVLVEDEFEDDEFEEDGARRGKKSKEEKFDPESVITKKRLVEELAALALVDYFDLVDDAGSLLPKRLLPAGVRAAVRDVKYVNKMDAFGNVETIAVPVLHDKKAALAVLARVLKLDVQRQEVSGPDGGPMQAISVLTQAAERVRAMREDAGVIDAGEVVCRTVERSPLVVDDD